MQKHVCIILKVLKRLRYHRSSSLRRLHCESSRPQPNDGWTVRSKRMHSHLTISEPPQESHLDETTSVTHEHTSWRFVAASSWTLQHTCVSWQDSHGSIGSFTTRISQGHQISQPVKSYSFETHGASMIYERREFFKGWSTESHSMTSEAENNLSPLHRSILLACDRYHGCLQIWHVVVCGTLLCLLVRFNNNDLMSWVSMWWLLVIVLQRSWPVVSHICSLMILVSCSLVRILNSILLVQTKLSM